MTSPVTVTPGSPATVVVDGETYSKVGGVWFRGNVLIAQLPAQLLHHAVSSAARVAELKKRLEEKWVGDCSYCEWLTDSLTHAESKVACANHARVCPSHPMRALERRVKEAEVASAAAVRRAEEAESKLIRFEGYHLIPIATAARGTNYAALRSYVERADSRGDDRVPTVIDAAALLAEHDAHKRAAPAVAPLSPLAREIVASSARYHELLASHHSEDAAPTLNGAHREAAAAIRGLLP